MKKDGSVSLEDLLLQVVISQLALEALLIDKLKLINRVEFNDKIIQIQKELHDDEK